jgi:excisionase family DNA binding protein
VLFYRPARGRPPQKIENTKHHQKKEQKMKINNSIPAQVIGAASAMLNAWRQELTPTTLVAAIQNYQAGTVQEAVDGAEKMLTRKQAAAILQTSMPTIYRLNRQGQLRFIHFGGRNVRIPYEDIQKLLDKEKNGGYYEKPI